MCSGQRPGWKIAQPLTSRHLAISTEMVEYQPPMSNEPSVALQPIRLPPRVERADDGGSFTQFGLDPKPCADERLDPERGSKTPRLVKIEVISTKKARDIDDS